MFNIERKYQKGDLKLYHGPEEIELLNEKGFFDLLMDITIDVTNSKAHYFITGKGLHDYPTLYWLPAYRKDNTLKPFFVGDEKEGTNYGIRIRSSGDGIIGNSSFDLENVLGDLGYDLPKSKLISENISRVKDDQLINHLDDLLSYLDLEENLILLGNCH